MIHFRVCDPDSRIGGQIQQANPPPQFEPSNQTHLSIPLGFRGNVAAESHAGLSG